MFRNPSPFNMQALNDMRLFTLTYEGCLKMGKLVPKWHEFEKLFKGKCFVVLESRIFDFISMTDEERYQKQFDQNRNSLTGYFFNTWSLCWA